MPPPQLLLFVAYRYTASPVFSLSGVVVISLLFDTRLHDPSIMKSRLEPVLFQTLYSFLPTYSVVEQESLPPALLTERTRVVLDESAPDVQESPFVIANVVHVPPCGEKLAKAGPFVTLKVRSAVSPD